MQEENWDPWTIFGWRLHSPFTPPSCSRPQPRNVRVLTSGPPGNSWTDQPRHGQSSHAPAPGEHIKGLERDATTGNKIYSQWDLEGCCYFFRKKLRTCWHLHAKRRICDFFQVCCIVECRSIPSATRYHSSERQPMNPITCLIVISGQPILLQAATFSAVRITLKSETNWKTTKQHAASWYSLGSNLVIFIASLVVSIVPSSKVSNHIKIRFTHNILSS